MENTLLKDIQAFAEQMAERLPKTKEGGVIILATDETSAVVAKIARKQDMVSMLAELLDDEVIVGILLELLADQLNIN